MIRVHRNRTFLSCSTIQAIVLALATACCSPAAARAMTSAPSDTARSSAPAVVTVVPAVSGESPRTFSVVLRAATKAERVKGLQRFRALLPGEAALFSFTPPRQVSFWMASLTYAIDIVFIDDSGSVTEVFAGCQPESKEVFSSAGDVRWVIETAEGSGIRPGDRVRFE